MTLTVSGLAAEVDLSSDTIRYYDRIGVLLPAPRTASGYRIYDEDAVERLRFVKGAQRLGLKLDEIRELLEIRDEGACPCGHADALLDKRIGELDEEIGRLTALRSELKTMVGARATEDRCIGALLHADRVEDDPS